MTWEMRMAQELALAEKALEEGNDGKARACARRAAGVVIAQYNVTHPESELRGSTAIERLRSTAADIKLPESVRQAARRLTTNVNQRLSAEFTLNPVLDARILVVYFSKAIQEKSS